MTHPVKVIQGASPLILGQAHGGTYLPDEIHENLNETGRDLTDTDWHISRNYHGLVEDITVVEATFHRYVIDANRDPDAVSLYLGQHTTTLCPTTDFDGQPIWNDGHKPDDAESARRQRLFHAPYDYALRNEIDRVRRIHGFVVLFDCHSIRSNIPYLFEGELLVFNTGTNERQTCNALVEQTVIDVCNASAKYNHVLNGRFKGGWTTRHYGAFAEGVHAIQMELAQRSYMQECTPWDYAPDRASDLRSHLHQMLHSLKSLNLSHLANS